MKRFVEGADRSQVTLLPECLDDYVAEDNPVRVIEVFIDELDLTGLGFEGVAPTVTRRPAYHPSVLLKIYVYGRRGLYLLFASAAGAYEYLSGRAKESENSRLLRSYRASVQP